MRYCPRRDTTRWIEDGPSASVSYILVFKGHIFRIYYDGCDIDGWWCARPGGDHYWYGIGKEEYKGPINAPAERRVIRRAQKDGFLP